MTRPHSTHHDDCGCLSERHAQQIADANAAIKRLTRERDEAIHAAAEGNGCAQALERQLAASQAECAALRLLGEALRREIDGVPNEGFDHQRAGRIQSKTMALLAALSRPPGSLWDKLAAAEARERELRAEVARGMESGAWEAVRALLSRPPGRSEALRAMLLQCAGAVWATAAPSVEMDSAECAAIVARLLGEGGSHE